MVLHFCKTIEQQEREKDKEKVYLRLVIVKKDMNIFLSFFKRYFITITNVSEYIFVLFP
jgi:hypothetical protein